MNSVALISTKQPVPRCPPQQGFILLILINLLLQLFKQIFYSKALTILIELQMTVKDNRETRLKSCAWTKIPLFDSKNRLLSGRWKVNLKMLPIKSDATINILDSLPEVRILFLRNLIFLWIDLFLICFQFIKFGNTELFYRLVNIRDSDEQTNAPISPAYANQYNYLSNLQVNI